MHKTETKFYDGISLITEHEGIGLKVKPNVYPVTDEMSASNVSRSIRLENLLTNFIKYIKDKLTYAKPSIGLDQLERYLGDAIAHKNHVIEECGSCLERIQKYKQYRSSDEYLTDIKSINNFMEFKKTKEYEYRWEGGNLHENTIISKQNYHIADRLIEQLKQLKQTQLSKQASNVKQHKKEMIAKQTLAATYKVNDSLIELRKDIQLKSKKPKKNIISYPIIARFCNLINDSLLLTKDSSETIPDYCKRVCVKFNLKYSDKVRQAYSNRDTKGYRQKVKDLILPLIDEPTSIKITEYLNTKYPPTQEMYG